MDSQDDGVDDYPVNSAEFSVSYTQAVVHRHPRALYLSTIMLHIQIIVHDETA